MIGILDMGMGNLRSVSNAIYNMGFDFEIIDDSQKMDDLTHLIIPGVGAYGAAMLKLREKELIAKIQKFAASGRPVMGICLGMQVLSSYGEEGGENSGLELISGRVVRIREEPGLAIPHVGWNNVNILADSHPVFEKVKSGVDFYFVHSYEFLCDDRNDIYSVCNYGKELVSAVGKKNVIGFQFHPEKSQVNGLCLLENFCRWDGKC